MAKLIPTQIRIKLEDIQANTNVLIEKLKKREEALQEELDDYLADTIIDAKTEEFEAEDLKGEIGNISISPEMYNTKFEKQKQQVEILLENIEEEITTLRAKSEEESKKFQQEIALLEKTIKTKTLYDAVTKLEQQRNEIEDDNEGQLAELNTELNRKKTALGGDEEFERLKKEFEDENYDPPSLDQLKDDLKKQNKKLKKEQRKSKHQLEKLSEKQKLLKSILQNFIPAQQNLQSQIKSVENFHNKLEKENAEVLGINNTVSLEAAIEKLTAIQEATSKLIPKNDPVSSTTIAEDKIITDLKAIHDDRSALLSNLVDDVADEELAKDVYLDFQYQVATLSAGKQGSTVTGANYKPSSQAEIDKLLKQLKTQRQIERESIKIYLRADGSLQGPDNPANVKAKVDIQILLTKQKNQQLQAPKPIKLYFNQYDSGSEEAHIIGMKHALAHGADHAEIINPDEEGKKWNKIFNVYFDLQAKPNDAKLFSEKKKSKYTRLIRELNFEKEAESKDLIQKTLSALEPEQISKLIEDLSADRDTTLFDKTINLVPTIIKERWTSDVNKTFKGMDSSNKAKLLYASVKHEQESSNGLLSWIRSKVGNQELKVPNYLKKFIAETPKNELLEIFKAFDQDPAKLNIKNALLNASGIAPNELQENNEDESDNESNYESSNDSDESDDDDDDDDEEEEEDGALNPAPGR